MEKFRNLTKNIFFRIFLGFLGITFVTFGVGDFILNSSSNWVLKVDGKKVSYNNFLQIIQNKRERIYRSNPNEQALQYLNSQKFKTDTLNLLIAENLIDLMKEHYGIYPEKELILEEILTQPRFISREGKFNKFAYVNFLKTNNLSEQKYIEEILQIIDVAIDI